MSFSDALKKLSGVFCHGETLQPAPKACFLCADAACGHVFTQATLIQSKLRIQTSQTSTFSPEALPFEDIGAAVKM